MDRPIVMRKTGLTLPPCRNGDGSVLAELIRLNEQAGLDPAAIVNMPAQEWFEKVSEKIRAA